MTENDPKWTIQSAFTLIELLVVISIIGILIGLSIFGLMGARQSSRDGKRKADLELVRSGLEIYKSDCNAYPITAAPTKPDDSTALNTGGSTPGSLVGSGVPSACSADNTYISQIPTDPVAPNQNYTYSSPDGSTYLLCASLEQTPNPTPDPGGPVGSCGSCGGAGCNYFVQNP